MALSAKIIKAIEISQNAHLRRCVTNEVPFTDGYSAILAAEADAGEALIKAIEAEIEAQVGRAILAAAIRLANK